MSKKNNEFRKKLLLAGRPGFIKPYLITRLNKEGWDVVDLEGDAFTLHNPEMVLYFSDGVGDENLITVMQESTKSKVGRFVYINSYTRENQSSYEDFVLTWGREHGLKVQIISLPELYGPGQEAHEGVLARLFLAACEGKGMQLCGRDDVKVNLLYIADAAYGIYATIQQELREEHVNICAEEKISFTELVLLFNGIAQLPNIEIVEGGTDFTDVGYHAASDMVIRQKYHLKDMLKSTLEAYQKELAGPTEEELAEKKKKEQFAKIKPYLENVGLFVVVVIISIFQGNTPVNYATGLDITYLYLIIMGILYGKKQSMPAIIPAICLLAWSLLSHHGEMASLLYLPENILHFTTYLFVGVFTGYIRDSWQGQLDSAGYKLSHMEQMYDFLKKNYHDSIAIKDKLYHQIINSDDSIGWLYGIIQQLDTVEVENIFTQAAAVTGRIMGTNNIAIYVMGKDQYYLRQKVRLGEKTVNLPHSRKTSEFSYIVNMLENQRLFVNHGLQLGAPDLAAPIIYAGNIIAVIEIYDMNFDQWSIYQQNLLSVTARLISMAMGKAYMYEEGVQSRRFIAHTRILQEAEFAKLQNGLRQRAALQDNVRNMLLELRMEGVAQDNYQELDNLLSGAIRQEDAVGVQDGKVYLLIHDADETGLELVKKRLLHRGIDVVDSRELI